MTSEKHGRIFAAFIQRVSSKQLETLARLARESEETSMNLGINHQLVKQAEVSRVAGYAVESIPPSDLDAITTIIRHQLKGV